MHFDLIPKQPPAGRKENILTVTNVFLRYFFAYSTANQNAKTIARIVPCTMTKHAHLPAAISSDKGSAFISQVIREKAGVLWITLNHATTKHAQTITMLERMRASPKKRLKSETFENVNLAEVYLIAVVSYYTTYDWHLIANAVVLRTKLMVPRLAFVHRNHPRWTTQDVF